MRLIKVKGAVHAVGLAVGVCLDDKWGKGVLMTKRPKQGVSMMSQHQAIITPQTTH